jgi:hypothetical protein
MIGLSWRHRYVRIFELATALMPRVPGLFYYLLRVTAGNFTFGAWNIASDLWPVTASDQRTHWKFSSFDIMIG